MSIFSRKSSADFYRRFKESMDGGNEIYMNLIPQWDGEDDSFDLNEVSLKELQQFPNLKKATIMTSNFEQVEDIFKSQGIKIERL